MNITIRSASLESDRTLLIDLLFHYLTPLSDGLRFDWLYRNNPHGQARAWIATDTESQVIVGTAAAFPRRMYVSGRDELGWVLGDFWVDDRYRSLGPALQLQRACLAEIDAEKLAFCYDFPSVSMMAVYKRLGIKPFGRMFRLAKPLRVDRKLNAVVKSPVIARQLSAVGNLLLTLRDRSLKSYVASRIAFHPGQCGEEFSTLSVKAGLHYRICLQRSAEYLNWRYMANPLGHYEFLTARSQGSLQAYAVFSHIGEDAILVDLFGVDEPAIISGLVAQLVTLLRNRGVVTLSATILEAHPWFPLLQRLGFTTREASPVVVYIPPHSPMGCKMLEAEGWFLMQGDRDS